MVMEMMITMRMKLYVNHYFDGDHKRILQSAMAKSIEICKREAGISHTIPHPTDVVLTFET